MHYALIHYTHLLWHLHYEIKHNDIMTLYIMILLYYTVWHYALFLYIIDFMIGKDRQKKYGYW